MIRLRTMKNNKNIEKDNDLDIDIEQINCAHDYDQCLSQNGEL